MKHFSNIVLPDSLPSVLTLHVYSTRHVFTMMHYITLRRSVFKYIQAQRRAAAETAAEWFAIMTNPHLT